MRSALDPLPRSISLQSLAILVVMLVCGVAISVQEYLDSARAPHRPCPSGVPIRAKDGADGSRSSACLGEPAMQGHIPRDGSGGAAANPIPMAPQPMRITPSRPVAPSLCEPDPDDRGATSSAPGTGI